MHAARDNAGPVVEPVGQLLKQGGSSPRLGAEPLELDADLGVVAGGQLDLERSIGRGGTWFVGLPVEGERAGVAGAEEALAVGRQVDGAAQVRALGREAR